MQELPINTLCRIVRPGTAIHGVLCFTTSLRQEFNFHWSKGVTHELGYMVKIVGRRSTTANGLPIGIPEAKLEPCLGDPDAVSYSRAQIWQPKQQMLR